MSYSLCTNGHAIELPSNFEPPKEVIACIGWCPLEVPDAKLGNIILPCNARTVWKRKQKEI